MTATDLARIKTLVKEERREEALQAILTQARATDDYNTYISLCRLRRKIADTKLAGSQAKKVRIAILGGATTEFLESPLELELETQGLDCELHCSEYNTFVPEMMDGGSPTAAFGPDVAILLLTPFNIADWPAVGDSPERVQALADGLCDHWLGLCAAFHGHTKSEIIVSNLHLLPTRAVGSLGSRLAWEPNSYLRRVNRTLSERAPAYVHLFDLETLSADYGTANWFDARFWHHSKQPVSFACLVPFIRNLSAIVGALYGRTAKCLVLDLDNTLWGGVVGDDGLEGIKIGEGDAESEAFKAFQSYLKVLNERGLLLAVCSKNEEENALAPFAELPEMVLKRDDFVAFKANWEPKSENLKAIAEALNIGLDSLVFVDDNPAEREQVRQSLPQVKVVELSEDPSEYPRLLDRSGWLEAIKLTDEDRKKTAQYQENAERQAMQSQAGDYDSYLASLDQRAVIGAFDQKNLDRITQLINKTNQFNLTTQRLTRSEVEALMARDDTVTATVRLIDRFGDNGLISVLSGHREDGTLHIDQWLMSCRVFKRGVEQLLANHLFDLARDLGVEKVRGTYIPTPKNKIVADLYPSLGFRRSNGDQEASSVWDIELDDYKPFPVHISPAEDLEE